MSWITTPWTVGRVRWPTTDCITDHFDRSALAGTPIPGRITETGGKEWNVTDGSDWQVFPLSHAACLADFVTALFYGVAWLDAGFSDGTIRTDVSPIGESNDPASRNGLVFRYVDDLNFWAFFNYRTPAGALGYFFRSYVGGTIGYDSGFLTAGARDTGPSIPLVVELNGSSIIAYYDGVERVNISDSTHQSATKHGMCSRDYGIDYFSACAVGEE